MGQRSLLFVPAPLFALGAQLDPESWRGPERDFDLNGGCRRPRRVPSRAILSVSQKRMACCLPTFLPKQWRRGKRRLLFFSLFDDVFLLLGFLSEILDGRQEQEHVKPGQSDERTVYEVYKTNLRFFKQ